MAIAVTSFVAFGLSALADRPFPYVALLPYDAALHAGAAETDVLTGMTVRRMMASACTLGAAASSPTVTDDPQDGNATSVQAYQVGRARRPNCCPRAKCCQIIWFSCAALQNSPAGSS